MQVKPGDVVELGGLNAFDGLGYNFPQVVIGTELFIIAQEQDVAFVDESPLAVASSYRVAQDRTPAGASLSPRI